MTLYEYQMRKVPESYQEMYLDGFTPEEILLAHRRAMMQSLANEKSINYNFTEIKIDSEVRLKK